MANPNAPRYTRSLGIISIVLAILGAAFYWYVPVGMILSLAGLLLGIIGWLWATGRISLGFVVGGVILSLAALILDFAVAEMGWQIVTFTALR